MGPPDLLGLSSTLEEESEPSDPWTDFQDRYPHSDLFRKVVLEPYGLRNLPFEGVRVSSSEEVFDICWADLGFRKWVSSQEEVYYARARLCAGPGDLTLCLEYTSTSYDIRFKAVRPHMVSFDWSRAMQILARPGYWV